MILAGPGSRGPPLSAGRSLQGPCRWVPPNEVASIFYEEQVILFSQIKTGKGEEEEVEEEERGQIHGEERKAEKNRAFLSSLFFLFAPLFLPLLPPASVCFTLLLRFTQKQPSPPSLFAFTATPINPISSPAISPSTYPLTWLWVQSALLTLCQVWHNSPSLLSPSL